MRGPALTPLSPVATATVLCRLGGALWVTVVVKATFQLVHGENARLVAAEELVSADRPGPHGSSLERARETAPHLPSAGVLLSGHACAPAGRAVPSMSVRLGISRDRPLVDKTLHVFGARSAASPGAVAPFSMMPLVYERAFGGPGIPENPTGTGGYGGASLPNIVDPRDARRPAGFAPVAGEWASRRAFLGGLDPAALAAAVLEVPAGFDWRYFQAAPSDQQIDRLRGDEWIVLDGMSPSLPRVQSRLPQVMALARRQVAGEGGVVAEQPIDLRADMLVIDADRMTASVIWRGRFPAVSIEALGAMRVLTGLERPGEPVLWPIAGRIAELVTADGGGGGGASAGRAGSGAQPGGAGKGMSSETTDVDLAAILGKKVPFSPGREPAAQGARDGLSAAAGVSGREEAAPRRETPLSTGTQEVSLAAILGKNVPFSLAHGSPPAGSAGAPGGPRRAPMSTGTTDVNVAELLKGAARHHGAPHSPAQVDPPLPVPVSTAPVFVAPPVAGNEPALPAATSPAALARKRATALVEAGGAFDEEDFAGANLSGLDLSGRSFVRCNLRGARLRGVKLAGAVLTRAVLDEADLRGAILEEADLREASLIGADLERARLAGCQGAGAVLREASLTGADLGGARFPGASFEAANLRDARADGVDLSGARLDGADLSGASFREARLSGAVLAFATLDRADLQRADLAGANLHQARRRMTRLAGANLTGTIEDPPGPRTASDGKG